MKVERTLSVVVVTLLLAVGATAQKAVKFTSVYTDLNTRCKTLHGSNGTDDAFLCPGPGGYKVEIYFSASTMQIGAFPRGSNENAPLATLDLNFDDRKTKLEWRLADGKPFAVIMRVPVYADPAQGEYFGKVIGQQLKVTGLVGYEIDETVDASTPNANLIAREAADKAYKPRQK